MDDTDRRLQLVRDHFAAINAADRERWDRAHSHDYEGEDSGARAAMTHAQHWVFIMGLRRAFPDLCMNITRTFECQEAVVVLWAASGTHAGPLPGPQGRTFEATHQSACVQGCSTFEFKGGKVSRQLGFFDNASLLSQLGLLS